MSDREGLLPNELEDQTWMIYANVYSICFEKVARNPVNICYRQLGLEKHQLDRKSKSHKMLPKCKLKQRSSTNNKNWMTAKVYKNYNLRWRERNKFLIKEGFNYFGPLINHVQV